MTSENSQIAAQLRAIVGELEDLFFERSEVIRALMIGVLSRQHSLMLGPPGTAKSELARELTGRFDGATFWEILLTKFTAPSEIFGPVDVGQLAQGRWTQIFDGHATQAHIGFLDEIFKGSSAALNTMLPFLNERLYHPESGGAPIRCPLISCVCASNELGSGEEVGAIFDRLLIRVEVGYLADPNNFAALLRSAVAPAAPPKRTTLPLEMLQTAVTTGVPSIAVPDGVVDAFIQLRAQLRRKEHHASDRRWKAAVRLIQASAYLDGRPEANTDDLLILSSVLWESVADRAGVEREVLQLVHPAAGEALTLSDAIDEVDGQLDSMAGQSEDALNRWALGANRELRQAKKKLQEMLTEAQTAGRPTSTVQRVIARCEAVANRVAVEALGIDLSTAPKL